MPKKVGVVKNTSSKSILARTDDGTVQLTITVPYEKVKSVREAVVKELVENLELPGFRKGKAPSDLAMKHLDKQKIYEHTLQHLLPEAYAKAVEEHSLKPVLAPRFELLSVEEEKDWQVRAITCEVPEVKLGDYKKEIKGTASASQIWVPGKDSGEKPKEVSREDKEQQAIKVLLEGADVAVPQLLVEEEVNHRLSQLLDQIQKLGLTVERYLASTGKTIEQVRLEYSQQAIDSIKLVLALNKVAEEEKLSVEEKEIDEVIKVNTDSSSALAENGEKTLNSPEQRRLIRAILLRRRALDSLVGLI